MVTSPWSEGDDVGNTPLDENELEGLIPAHISTRSELNEWEARNIEQALEWTLARTPDVLREDVLRTLHRKMFDKTWKWAGRYRRSDKSISPFHWSEVPRLVRDLLDNTRLQHELDHATLNDLDELAARFHHELVRIHAWPNGNGRHARLATDMLLRRWSRQEFSWGSRTYVDRATLRAEYVRALRDADGGSYERLASFVRS